jgi:hypothetical protein
VTDRAARTQGRVRTPIADVQAGDLGVRADHDDETRSHRIVDRTTAWPAAIRPTARFAADPAQPPPPAPADGPPPRRGLRIAGMVLACLAAVVAAVLVGTHSSEPTRRDLGGVATGTPNPKHPPQLDVSLDECRIARDGAHVAGTTRNPMDGAVVYLVEVRLVDDRDATITSATIQTSAVAPGSTAAWSGVLPPVAAPAQDATCRLVKVDRRDAA